MAPRNTEEQVTWLALCMTYPLYLLGALYVTGPALAWVLLALVLLRAIVVGVGPVGTGVWLWIVGMLVMLVALLVGHERFALGAAATFKSVVGWAKGWALLALFILAGACLRIRPELITRACCVLGAHGILFFLVSLVAYGAGIGHLYLPPWSVISGGGPEFFDVALSGVNVETGLPRWRFFAPWAPAAGFVGCLLLVICLGERSQGWRTLGVVGALVMIVSCQSRMGWVVAPLAVSVLLLMPRLKHPATLMMAGACVALTALVAVDLLELGRTTLDEIKALRPESTLVRTYLEDIALQRWRDEALLWGHGQVESGPHLVKFMPIGTHHTWYGLLFVKGVVGAAALAVPLVCTLLFLLVCAPFLPRSAEALALTLVVVLYTFSENIEILAYLLWPALMLIGRSLTLPRGEFHETV